MRYVIIGAGAVGSTVAAQLHLAGIPVVLIARGEHGKVIGEHGLRYLRPEGEQRVRVPVAAGAREVELTTDDVLVLATEAQHTEDALREWSWRPAGEGVAADLPLVSLQNGLENERAALRRFGTVFGASLWLPATCLTPGEVSAEGVRAPGILWLGRYPDGPSPRLDGIAEDFRRAAFMVQVVADLSRWKAGKLLSDLVDALDVLCGERVEPVLDALRAEALRVFAAAGIGVADFPRESDVDISVVGPVETGGRSPTSPSMARGAEPVEVDFLNGEIVLLGRLHGVPAPLNALAQRLLSRAAERGEAPGSMDADELRRQLEEAVSPGELLVSAGELAGLLRSANPPVLLDVRWALGDPHGHRHYLDGHIPGAVYVDLDTELAAPPDPANGRHPLPELEDLQAAARRWGVRQGSRVVVYDNNGNLAAARAWWLLRWAGVTDVRLLDGGLAAWTGPLEAGFGPSSQPGDVVLKPGNLPVLSIEDAAALPRTGTLLDARAGERYRGEQEPVDPRAGHIPGALSAPTSENLGADGRFRSRAELGERFRELGAGDGPVGVYCGSGVTAAHEIAALAIAGIEAALYPGSWSQWSADADRSVATGPDPGTA